jgi:ribosome-binding protein aMBF1 (putative translation factor)
MTTNAIKILNKRLGDTPERRARIEEEKANLSAASIIHEAREKACMTQKELAEKIGTKQSVISRLENADYDGHTLTMLKKIAEALDMELAFSMRPKNTVTVNKSRRGRASFATFSRKRKAAMRNRLECPI